MTEQPLMPSEVSKHVGAFDRFASAAARVASRAWFFCFCVLLVVLWAPSIILIRSIDTWQLIINTLTTIITFLMVALLQNSQTSIRMHANCATRSVWSNTKARATTLPAEFASY